MNNSNNKNVFLAIALAGAVLFLWQYFIATPAMKTEQARQAALTRQEKTKPAGAPSLCACSMRWSCCATRVMA